jgi:drug/metabolite transporter (DMT)-like permease
MTTAEDPARAASQAAGALDARAMLIMVVCCACWGVNQVAVKVANQGISPMLQVGLRSLLAGVLVLAWTRARGIRLFDRDRTLWPGIVCGVLFGAEFVILYIGLGLTTASRGIVFLYLAPFLVAFSAHYLIPGDRLTVAKLAGLVAAMLGLVVAMGESLTQAGQPTLAGDLLCVLAAVLWGATTVLIRTTTLRSAMAEKTLLYQLGVSGLVLPPLAWLFGEPGIINLSGPVLLSFSYTVVIVAFVSYIIWFWLVKTYAPTRVSAFSFLAPVFGVLAGIILLGEPFTPSLAAALALVAFGIYLVNRPAQ